MVFTVKMSTKTEKMLRELSEDEAASFVLLKDDMVRTKGKPYTRWKNCGPVKQLGTDYYHCHLSNSTVVVWLLDKKNLLCKITYVGSREKAPYL